MLQRAELFKTYRVELHNGQGSFPVFRAFILGGDTGQADERGATWSPTLRGAANRRSSFVTSATTIRSFQSNMPISNVLAALFAVLVHATTFAQSPPVDDRTRDNLMVVVRESVDMNRAADALTPMGKLKGKLPDGREIEVEMAAWEFIGDTHIRFVFDTPQTMINATPQDLERLGIKGVDEALSVALVNLKRVYGEPSDSPWQGGLMSVEGKSADFNSSYFLDRAYWQGLLKSHPEGLVVSVAKRGGLLYAPASSTKAVEGLKRRVAYLHASSLRLRVSSALFLFKEGKWSVFQAPVKQQ